MLNRKHPHYIRECVACGIDQGTITVGFVIPLPVLLVCIIRSVDSVAREIVHQAIAVMNRKLQDGFVVLRMIV